MCRVKLCDCPHLSTKTRIRSSGNGRNLQRLSARMGLCPRYFKITFRRSSGRSWKNMETFQDEGEEVEKSKGLGPIGLIDEVAAVHVSLRVETGFDLVQIIAEYRALRSSKIRLWAKDRKS